MGDSEYPKLLYHTMKCWFLLEVTNLKTFNYVQKIIFDINCQKIFQMVIAV